MTKRSGIARQQRLQRKAQRHLRVERLEPRTVLSSLGLIASGVHLVSPRMERLSEVFDAKPTVRLGDLKPALTQSFVVRQGSPSPESFNPTAGTPVPHEFPQRPAGLGDAPRSSEPAERKDVQAEGGMVHLGIVPAVRTNPPAGSPMAEMDLSVLRLGKQADVSQAPREAMLFGGLRPAVSFPKQDQAAGEGSPLVFSVKLGDAPPPPDGGWVELNVPAPARRMRSAGQFLAMGEPLMVHPAAVPNAPTVANDFAFLVASRASSSVAVDSTAGTASSSPDMPPPPKATTASAPTGPVSAPTHDSGLVTDRNSGWAGASRGGSANAAEGGLIDLNFAPGASARWAGRTDDASPVEPGGDAVSREAEQSGREAESRTEMGIAADGGWSADRGSDPGLWREDSARASDPTEGGMVELVAAAFPSAQSARVVEPSPVAANSDRLDVKEVRMDHGVALFHAFELATSLPQNGGSTLSPFAEDDAIGVPIGTVAPASSPMSPTADGAAAASENPQDPPVQRSGTVRTVLVASFIASFGLRGGITLAERRRRDRTSPKTPPTDG